MIVRGTIRVEEDGAELPLDEPGLVCQRALESGWLYTEELGWHVRVRATCRYGQPNRLQSEFELLASSSRMLLMQALLSARWPR